MKIAIDGPSASGKGTLTKLLAQEIGAKILNTGKLYRVVAFSIQNHNVEQEAVINSANFLQHLELHKHNPAIYSQKNSILTSKISAILQVRENLLKFQKDFANAYSPVILEGRDIGTHILPDANFKFYITASSEERARRRYAQLSDANITFADTLQAIKQRDKQDQTRANNPLIPAKDAITIDTTFMSIEESLKKMMEVMSATTNKK